MLKRLINGKPSGARTEARISPSESLAAELPDADIAPPSEPQRCRSRRDASDSAPGVKMPAREMDRCPAGQSPPLRWRHRVLGAVDSRHRSDVPVQSLIGIICRQQIDDERWFADAAHCIDSGRQLKADVVSSQWPISKTGKLLKRLNAGTATAVGVSDRP